MCAAVHAQAGKGIGRAALQGATRGLETLCSSSNGATDINWIAVIKQYPDIQFVDYTKNRSTALVLHAQGKLPANYHITFPFSGDNHGTCDRVLAAGGNVAVCFEGRVSPNLAFNGADVIGGDLKRLLALTWTKSPAAITSQPSRDRQCLVVDLSPREPRGETRRRQSVSRRYPNLTKRGAFEAPFAFRASKQGIDLSRMSGAWFVV